MPRKSPYEPKTLRASTDPRHETVVGVESDAAGASVDITDEDIETAIGYVPTDTEFYNDFRVVRVPVATSADEAAATISLASVKRNGGDDGWTVTFSAAAAATKKVGVRVVSV